MKLRGQQRERKGGNKFVWDEPDVLSGGKEKTQPHPGQKAWAEETNYRTIDPLFYDLETRCPKDRPYDATGTQTTEDVPLKDGYIVTVAN